jgi:hypothetical protein
MNDENRMTNDELSSNDETRKVSVIVSRFVVRASTFDIRASSFVSFVAERFDGVERGSFARRIKAEENANGCAE